MTKKLRILFLGSENSRRSILAEALLRAKGGDGVTVSSAGVVAGEPSSFVSLALKEIGIDPPDHAPMEPADLTYGPFDVVISLGQGAKEYCNGTIAESSDNPAVEDLLPAASKRPLGLVHLHWDITDPLPGPGGEKEVIARFRVARDKLRGRIEELLDYGYLTAFEAQKQHLQDLTDGLEVGLMAMDNDTTVYLFNRAAEKITGRKREEVIGRGCRRVFAPHGICGAECSFSKTSGCSIHKHEHMVSFMGSDGAAKRLRVALSPLKLPGFYMQGMLAAISDITETSLSVWGKGSFHGMVGVAEISRNVFETIRHVARSDYPILITGESGTGKELAAKAIHLESKRAGGPFVPINCGALPENILESELFGHVRGAFTGAIRDKKGRFELADGGTILLDEVGELSPAFQVRLLRVLQEKQFERVGGEHSISVDVRIVCCSNKNLRAMVKDGSFREDLFYRLSVIPMTLPPLRERAEDLGPLIGHILSQIRRESDKPIRRVSDDTMARLVAYQWPGNIRELINALQFASIHCSGEVILPQHLPPEIKGWDGTPFIFTSSMLVTHSSTPGMSHDETGEDHASVISKRRGRLTIETVGQALEETGGNKVRAAKLLGVGRATLYRFLKATPL